MTAAGERGQEQATERAVDELNRRLSRAQRRLVAATTMAAVAAGLGGAVWTLVDFEFTALAVRLTIPSLVIGAIATLGLGAVVMRGALGLLKGPWARALAKEHGADAAEVESFALPFGGPPGREGSSGLWRQGAALAAGFVALEVAVGVFLDWETAVRVACTVAGAVTTVAFYGYLGFRRLH